MPIASEVRRPQVLPPNASRWMWDSALQLSIPFWHPLTAKSPFTSMDKNAHSVTVTGATWGIQGRTLGGIDDVIRCGTNATLDFSTNFSLVFWVKFNSLKNQMPINRTTDYSVNGYYAYWTIGGSQIFRVLTAGVDKSITSTTAYAADTWYHYFIQKSGTTGLIVRNGTDITTSCETLGDPTSNIGNFDVGYLVAQATYACDAEFGEVRAYNRALSLAEGKKDYLATKWRYL